MERITSWLMLGRSIERRSFSVDARVSSVLQHPWPGRSTPRLGPALLLQGAGDSFNSATRDGPGERRQAYCRNASRP
jgi:hypothetical protein